MDCSMLDTWLSALYTDCSVVHAKCPVLAADIAVSNTSLRVRTRISPHSTPGAAPFADCSALDTWRLMFGPDCSVPCILRPALGLDCSVPIALRLRADCELLRSQQVRLVPCADCSTRFPWRCAPLTDFSLLGTWRSHRSRIAPRSTLGALCFTRIAPHSTLGVLC